MEHKGLPAPLVPKVGTYNLVKVVGVSSFLLPLPPIKRSDWGRGRGVIVAFAFDRKSNY